MTTEGPKVVIESEEAERGIYANELGMAGSDNDITIDFRKAVPDYEHQSAPKHFLVARVSLSWQLAKKLAVGLNKLIDDAGKEAEAAKTK